MVERQEVTAGHGRETLCGADVFASADACRSCREGAEERPWLFCIAEVPGSVK